MNYYTGHFDSDVVQTDEVVVYNYNGVPGDSFQVYYEQQHADFVVPPTGSGITGSPAAGLTNQQNWNQFRIALAGAVAPASATTRSGIKGLVTPLLVDNSISGFGVTGGWSPFAGQGFQGDVSFASAGAGDQTATWTFAVSPGQYRVAATWSPHANRATDAPFTIFDGAVPLATVRVDQEQAPNGFLDAGVGWTYLGGILNITGSTLTVRLSDAANQYVIADAIRLERVGGLVVSPEIEVLDGSGEVADGGSFSFGDTFPGVPIDKTFRVRNVGRSSLTLQPVNVPAGFMVVSNIAPNTVLAGGAETSFTVRLLASITGSFTGQFSFANTDSNENPYNFSVSGTASLVRTIDDGQTGFKSVGGWEPFGGQGFQNDVEFVPAGSGSRVATWLFGITPGQYRLAVTWSPHANRASNAPYLVRDGGSSIVSLALDQRQAPDDFSDQGASWEYLGGILKLTSTTLVVSLSDQADQYVIADAVRFERIGDLPAGPEIQVLDGATEVSDGTGQVNFGTNFVGVPSQRTFRVRNTGAGSLTLQSVSVPSGFSIVTNIPANTVLAAGAETTFTVQLDAAVLGSFSGQLSFANTDDGENPYTFTIGGTVAAVQIIDNGFAGFSTVGYWSPFGGEGYQNHVHFTGAGSGATKALWTFAVSPGQYRVAATWSSHSNRANNAPFTIYNDSTVLLVVPMSQQQGPNDLGDSGANWEYLGGVLDITGSALTVKLTDLANGYVIADAIRLERIGDLPGGQGRPEPPAAEGASPPAGELASSEEQPSESEEQQASEPDIASDTGVLPPGDSVSPDSTGETKPGSVGEPVEAEVETPGEASSEPADIAPDIVLDRLTPQVIDATWDQIAPAESVAALIVRQDEPVYAIEEFLTSAAASLPVVENLPPAQPPAEMLEERLASIIAAIELLERDVFSIDFETSDLPFLAIATPAKAWAPRKTAVLALLDMHPEENEGRTSAAQTAERGVDWLFTDDDLLGELLMLPLEPR